MTRQSLVGDAAYHLLAGHQALRYGENRLNLEHPPLVKLMAALPLLAEEPLAEPLTVDQVLGASLSLFDDPGRLHRVRVRARAVVALVFGLPFLALCYALGHRTGGRGAGVVLFLFMGLSISVVPYLSILQTDTAAALGMTAVVIAALGYLTTPGTRAAAGLGLGLGLALAAKFSGVLAAPAAGLALLLAPRVAPGRRLRHGVVTALLATAFVWTSYAMANRHYDPDAGRDTIERYCRGEALIVDDRMRPYETPLLAVERHAPGLAQWLTGFVGIRLQNEIGVYPSLAFGDLSSKGRWWYFPAVFLIKTPLAILAASLLAALAWWRGRGNWNPPRRSGTLLAVVVLLYIGTAMTSNYNLGIRHLLPVLPLLYLPAALWTARRRWRVAVVVGLLALEAVATAPLWMSATNTWWLGPLNPTRFALSTGDADYRQNFLALDAAAQRRGIERLHVVYPLVAAKEIRAYIPRAVAVGPDAVPRPGDWYAVNTTVEQYLRAIPETAPEDVRGYAGLAALARLWEPALQRITTLGEDHGYVAGTFHLYRMTTARD